jgi:molecular chaperone GrpE
MATKDAHQPAADAPDTPDPQDSDASSNAIASNEASLDTLKRERDDFYERLLRKTAEFDNYRKRIERERRELSDHVVTELLLNLLSVVDDFERALEAEGGDRRYRKGIELIYTKLQDVLRKRGVQPIEALGKIFDPNIHQAVVHEESPAHQEGEVIAEMQRGYMLRDRLLRPSMVKVAKA